MDRHEKLTEAKLMAVENILLKMQRDWGSESYYDYAKEILSAIKDVEIKYELLDHEASLEESSRNKPE